MPVPKEKLYQNFTTLDNKLLQNSNMTCQAHRILTYGLSLPENWNFNLQAIAKKFGKSVAAIRWAMRELKRLGYVHFQKMGFNKPWKYFFFQKPITSDEFKNFLRTEQSIYLLRKEKKERYKKEIYKEKKDTCDLVEQSKKSDKLKNFLRTEQSIYLLKKEKEERYKKEIYKEKRAAPRTSAQASVLCNYFLNSIKSKKQDFVRDISPCWLTQADQLLNTRSVEQIKRVIDYAHKSEYWLARLLSLKALKNCMDTIELQMVKRYKPKTRSIDDKQKIEYNKFWAQQHEYTAPGGYAMALDDRYIVVDGNQVKELFYNADVPDWIALASNPFNYQQLKCI